MKYALTTFEMLIDAIHTHYKQKQGALPRAIELHPEVVNSLYREVNPYDLDLTTDGTMKLGGVPIVVNAQASRPKMVTSDNVVEYL